MIVNRLASLALIAGLVLIYSTAGSPVMSYRRLPAVSPAISQMVFTSKKNWRRFQPEVQSYKNFPADLRQPTNIILWLVWVLIVSQDYHKKINCSYLCSVQCPQSTVHWQDSLFSSFQLWRSHESEQWVDKVSFTGSGCRRVWWAI